MTCKEFVELVTAYLEETLPEEQRIAFEEHMALCLGCDTYLEQFRQTIAILGALPQASLSAPGHERLLGAFASWHRGSRPETP